jgi:hypothetical protein
MNIFAAATAVLLYELFAAVTNISTAVVVKHFAGAALFFN